MQKKTFKTLKSLMHGIVVEENPGTQKVKTTQIYNHAVVCQIMQNSWKYLFVHICDMYSTT